MVRHATIISAPILPGETWPLVYLWASADGSALYATPGAGPDASTATRLYKTLDGASWTMIHDFGQRSQGPAPEQLRNDYIRGLIELPSGTLIACCVNNSYHAQAHAAVYRGVPTADPYVYTWTRASYAGDDLHTMEISSGYARGWNMDHNERYAVLGTYGITDTAGTIHRDIWMSTDDGEHWARIFRIQGDGSDDAKSKHCHMARIDPDGGCWLSWGDGEPGSSVVRGVWHAPASALTGEMVSGQRVPKAVGVGAHDWGDFTRVYWGAGGAGRHPVVGAFRESGGGQKHIILGGDWEDRTILTLRYDDGSYTAAGKLTLALPCTIGSAPTGAVFGLQDIGGETWLATTNTEYNAVPYMLISIDDGETWQVQFETASTTYILRHQFQGKWYLNDRTLGPRGQIYTPGRPRP